MDATMSALTHQDVDTRPVYLFLRCECGARRELLSSMQSVRLAVELSGWTLATIGSRDGETCQACVAKARGVAA